MCRHLQWRAAALVAGLTTVSGCDTPTPSPGLGPTSRASSSGTPISLMTRPEAVTPVPATASASSSAAGGSRASDCPAHLVIPQIAEQYPATQTYSPWRSASPEGCPKLEDVSDLAVGDVDGDEVPEIVFSSLKIEHTKGLYVMRRKADDATWGCPEPLRVSQPVTRVAIADLERDNVPDVVAASSCGGHPCLLKIEAKSDAEPSTLFEQAGASTGANATDFRIADLNQDGVLDIAVSVALLQNPDRPFAPLVLTGRLEGGSWRPTVMALAQKLTHGFAVEIGTFAGDGGLGLLFGGTRERSDASAQQRQPVGMLTIPDTISWQTYAVETQASGKSEAPRWVIDFALGTASAEVGLTSAHSHCTGSNEHPYACTPDAASELQDITVTTRPTTARRLAKENGEWKSLVYLGPNRWAVGFEETKAYSKFGSCKLQRAPGGVLLVDKPGSQPTSQIPGRAISVQDLAVVSLRSRAQQDELRVPARKGAQTAAYPLNFAPTLRCGGNPTKVPGLTWVPESRLVTIPELPSPCPNAELSYPADKRPVLVALDRKGDGVFVSEPR